ncbi:hypothetical protein RIF29_34516 [Crotalaria pallida]|uniref:Late embryogenesis abundant protein LEA-2 subgroup domain-containing protein n=1 Tax=Crotalaria pallida TaxID=3830 RepID=A0AAN9HTK3_CROPI
MANQSPSVKPLAPYNISSSRYNTPEHEIETISDHRRSRLGTFTLCCGCITALLLISIVIILILGFTVYNVNEPVITMNRIINLDKGTNITKDNPINVTLIADISMKNTNYFIYRSKGSTTTLYYDGIGIGEGFTPPGKAKARRTVRFNVTLKIVTSKLINVPGFSNDTVDQSLNLSTLTRIDGNVKILGMFKKKVVVELNCTAAYNITSGLIHGYNCLSNYDNVL